MITHTTTHPSAISRISDRSTGRSCPRAWPRHGTTPRELRGTVWHTSPLGAQAEAATEKRVMQEGLTQPDYLGPLLESSRVRYID